MGPSGHSLGECGMTRAGAVSHCVPRPRPELWNSQPFTTLSALDTPTECLETVSLTFPLARRILSTLSLV